MPPTSMTGADLIAAQLQAVGIDHLFGFPGESTLPLAVAAQRARLTHVIAGCERCAGYMADGYVRFSDRLAVCYAPGGIGSPWLLPALLEAKNSSIPLIFISVSQPTTHEGRWTTSSFDHAAFDGVTKTNLRVTRADLLAPALRTAVRVATAPRTGPCHLDIPSDLLSTSADPAWVATGQEATFPSFRSRAEAATLARVRERLAASRAPLVVLGGGVQLSRVPPDLVCRFADVYDVDIAVTLNGKGAVSEAASNERFVGVVGQKGQARANAIARAADLVILVGTKMGDKSSLNWTLVGQTQAVIQVDVDPAEIGRSFPQADGVLSDARTFFEDLLIDAPAPSPSRQTRTRATPARDETPLPIQAGLCRALSDVLRDDDVLIADASQSCGWMGVHFRSQLRPRGTASPRGTGSIGFALPAAIGAALARPGRQVVAIGGDAGLSMAMHEMETCVRVQTPVKFFLLNNQNRLGLLEWHLEHFHGARDVFGPRHAVDWTLVARAFGWRDLRVASAHDIAATVAAALDTPGPVLIDVPCDRTLSPDFENTMRLDRQPADA
jgi:acetolactate synthase-1/2/3 large subunit